MDSTPTLAGAARSAEAEISSVLTGLLAELRPVAERHGRLYGRLWEELGRAAAGGKRFRGRLVVELHDALGGTRRAAAAQVGAAFELLHVGFLVHDDLIDHDMMRRGEPNLASRMAFAARDSGADEHGAQQLAEGAAVLAGDLAISLAHRLVASVDAPPEVHTRLQQLLWDTVFVSVAGELGDVAAALGLQDVSLEDALRIAAEKTALYSFQAPLRAGAILAGAPPAVREEVEAVGLALGKAFQLVDDLLGVFAPESVTGKSALSDLREGKATTLVLHARTLPVWSRIGADVGRADLDEGTAAVLRRELALSAAPERVAAQAREELAAVDRVLEDSALLARATGVVGAARAVVAKSLDDALSHVRAAAS
ncbi:geranylgeranyl diphosphate synthase, type II [Georgenia satyanarayanai]|uniref:Geranylgeranyl diphosphate synthase, type II n=1 Tax=Georgenia satyanarayanai TaxID=860221 RepID=A0A2Y9ASM8_9MICO|nr:polyprenyl synthetase family protein [Georgenia satyanarayanai]PYF96284.1 geranylgeranyl diphosphate synthase type II [Georgenia satyanarayanai]SSA47066.1 geranylgeranyl diphosphate synthase, type II [Georgenia satyanarayanai]